mmetsp:Transcript_114850/g.223101  ORF Transcript_114850/g.223101 Transcript_114850/m.223101 type:complete len:293 (-) Transcript_114850:18-896(-)
MGPSRTPHGCRICADLHINHVCMSKIDLQLMVCSSSSIGLGKVINHSHLWRKLCDISAALKRMHVCLGHGGLMLIIQNNSRISLRKPCFPKVLHHVCNNRSLTKLFCICARQHSFQLVICSGGGVSRWKPRCPCSFRFHIRKSSSMQQCAHVCTGQGGLKLVITHSNCICLRKFIQCLGNVCIVSSTLNNPHVRVSKGSLRFIVCGAALICCRQIAQRMQLLRFHCAHKCLEALQLAYFFYLVCQIGSLKQLLCIQGRNLGVQGISCRRLGVHFRKPPHFCGTKSKCCCFVW